MYLVTYDYCVYVEPLVLEVFVVQTNRCRGTSRMAVIHIHTQLVMLLRMQNMQNILTRLFFSTGSY